MDPTNRTRCRGPERRPGTGDPGAHPLSWLKHGRLLGVRDKTGESEDPVHYHDTGTGTWRTPTPRSLLRPTIHEDSPRTGVTRRTLLGCRREGDRVGTQTPDPPPSTPAPSRLYRVCREPMSTPHTTPADLGPTPDTSWDSRKGTAPDPTRPVTNGVPSLPGRHALTGPTRPRGPEAHLHHPPNLRVRTLGS